MARIIWALAVLTGMLVFIGADEARAQDDIVFEKHSVVDFGDDTIDGNLNKPDGQYLESQKRRRHERLIRVRQNFRPEILQSVRIL